MKTKSLQKLMPANIVLLLLCGLCAQAQQAKTLAVAPRTGNYAGQTFYTNSHALIIGIHSYVNLPKEKWLDFADKDATDLREVLVRSYGFLSENVVVLLNEQATKQGIEDALSALADEEKVKQDDRVLVFFSGHGQTVQLNDGTSRGFLIPYDAKIDLQRLNNAAPYLKTCLPMDSIWNYLEAIPARHRLLIADACFGGLLVKNKALSPEKPNPSVVANLLSRPALQVLTAGSSGETVIEDPKLGHSAFTFKLLEELRAQATTADQVFLTSQLAGALKTSVGNQTDGKQSPQFGNHNNTEGDFVFVSTPPRTVPALDIAKRAIAGSPVTSVVPAKRNSLPMLLVSDYNTGVIKIFDGLTGRYINDFASGNGIIHPTQVLFGPDGNLYVGADSSILRFNGKTGQFLDVFVPKERNGGAIELSCLTFGPDGNLYACSRWTNEIKRYDGRSGAYIDTFVAKGSGGLDIPSYLHFGPDHNLYVTSYNNNCIKVYHGKTGRYLYDFVSGNGIRGLSDFCFGPDQRFYVASSNSREIKRFDSETGAFIDNYLGADVLGGEPIALTFGQDGNLYIVTTANDVKRFNGRNGKFMDIFVSGNGLERPLFLVFH